LFKKKKTRRVGRNILFITRVDEDLVVEDIHNNMDEKRVVEGGCVIRMSFSKQGGGKIFFWMIVDDVK
jgi:hypothetical protein